MVTLTKKEFDRKAYAALILEAHKPKISRQKQMEMEELRRNLKTKSRLALIAMGEFVAG